MHVHLLYITMCFPLCFNSNQSGDIFDVIQYREYVMATIDEVKD